MLAPERRTRLDLVVAALLAIASLTAATAIWLTSDARGTTSTTDPAGDVVAQVPLPTAVPDAVKELWHAENRQLPPMVAANVVITTDSHSVIGRDPHTGKPRWSYTRDRELCTATVFSTAVYAVYRDHRGCAQVTGLRTSDGHRAASRSGAPGDPVTFTADSRHMLALGQNRLEVWRYDLVKTLEYGRVDAVVNPNSQPRHGCSLNSAQLTTKNLAVVESCPDELGDRLTVLNPSPKENDHPEEVSSRILQPAVHGARVLAGNEDRVLLYLPPTGAAPARLSVTNEKGDAITTVPLPAPLPDEAVVRRVGSQFILWTPAGITALRATDFTPTWVYSGARGTGDDYAGRLVVPTASGLVSLNTASGLVEREVTVSRGAFPLSAPIELAVCGDVIVEQRGANLFALALAKTAQ